MVTYGRLKGVVPTLQYLSLYSENFSLFHECEKLWPEKFRELVKVIWDICSRNGSPHFQIWIQVVLVIISKNVENISKMYRGGNVKVLVLDEEKTSPPKKKMKKGPLCCHIDLFI